MEPVHLSWSSMYFKMNLYKYLNKYPVVKKSTLSSNYFKNNLKLVKQVWKMYIY